jgi:lipoprotein-anchoring transpeptidase ErfK/SrfK
MRLILLFVLLMIYQLSFASKSECLNNLTYEEPDIDSTFFQLERSPEQENIFIFSPKKHLWAVYDKNGKRMGLGQATGGKDYCSDTKEPCRTVTGKFQVFRKNDEDCTSNTFPIDEGGGAPMPFCIFFHKGYAIHGSNHVTHENISHGCIRVTQNAAKWISENYIHHGSYVLVLPYEQS